MSVSIILSEGLHIRACLKIAFRKMYSTICGIFGSNKGGVAGYADRIWDK